MTPPSGVVITIIFHLVPRRPPPVYSLPGELMEEIILYLPPSCYCSLALVSKTFSTWFRWRRIDSGSALSPSHSFNTLLRNPTNADFVREATIHKSFFAPKIEDQWFLEGEPDDIRTTAWKNAQALKEGLLANVLQNTVHLRRLALTDVMELPSAITGIITDMCRTSLRTLDLCLEDRLLDLLGQDLTNVRDLTLRRGLYDGKQAARIVHVLAKFPRLSSLCFVDAEFDTNASVFFRSVMEACPVIRQVVFEKCSGLHDSPSALLVNGLQHCQIIATQKDDPLTFGYVPGRSRDAAFQQLKTFAFVLHPALVARPEDGIIGDEGMDGINAILQAAPNMKSFAFSNIPVFSAHGPIGALHLPDQIVQSLSVMRLRSLTLVGPVLIRIPQLRIICDSMPDLLQLTVSVEGSSKDISRYSPWFCNMKHLIVLQVILTVDFYFGWSQPCACGHQDNPRARVPHREEGTGIGRLIRRFTHNNGPAVVRLLLKRWREDSDAPHNSDRPNNSDVIRWIEHDDDDDNENTEEDEEDNDQEDDEEDEDEDEDDEDDEDYTVGRDQALKKLEDVVGLFRDRVEAERMVFTPAFWAYV